MIISVHIPKTAGCTFLAYLMKVFSNNVMRDYGVDTIEVSQLFESCFKEVDSINKYGLFRIRLISEGLEMLRQTLKQRNVQAIHGHFRINKYYGIFPNATTVIWLRDPVERALSHYHFHKRILNPNDRTNKLVYDGKLSFADWMVLDENINSQHYYVNDGLDKFTFVGIVEEFNAGLSVLNQILNMPDLDSDVLQRINVNPQKSVTSRYLIDDRTRERFLELNHLDIALYQEATQRFKEHQKAYPAETDQGVDPSLSNTVHHS